MNSELITLITTTALLLGSPGPAPLSLAFTSSNFGLKTGLKYLAGILAGLLVVTVATGFGLYEVLKVYPRLIFALSIFALIYMLYVAYKIAFISNAPGSSLQEKAPNFKDGLILNVINPKAYAAFFSIFSSQLLSFENRVSAVVLTGGVAFAVGIFVDVIWVLLGSTFSQFSKDKRRNACSRKVCGALLALLVFYMLYKM